MNTFVIVSLAGIAIAAIVYAWRTNARSKAALANASTESETRLTTLVEDAKRQAVKETTATLGAKHRQEVVAAARLLAKRARKAEQDKETKRVQALVNELEKKAGELFAAKQYDQANVVLSQLIAIAQYTGNRFLLATHLYNQGRCLMNQRDIIAAEGVIKQAIAEGEGVLDAKPDLTRRMQQRLADCERQILDARLDHLLSEGRARQADCPDMALNRFEAAVKLAEENDRPLDKRRAVHGSFKAWVNSGKLEEGCVAVQAAHRLALEKFGDEHKVTEALAKDLYNLESRVKARRYDELMAQALKHIEDKELPEAEEKAREALVEARRQLGPRDWRVAAALQVIAFALMRGGNSWDALENYDQALDLAIDFATDRPELLKQIQANMEACRKYM